jgi:thymidylate synthase (FAD)
MGDPQIREIIEGFQRSTAQSLWESYKTQKDMGVCNEVARMYLPFALYSSMYFTANLRSVLNFLSLRKDWGEDAVHASKAQFEIALVADKIAEIVKEKYPTVWQCFVDSGYQAV